MQIGELSQRTGFSRDTIRYYEKLGLISFQDKRTHRSSHKNYPQEVLDRLIAIKQIKSFGFTLEEMKNLFLLFEAGVLKHDRGKKYLQRKITVIEKKISELNLVKQRLLSIVDEKEDDCTIKRILLQTESTRNNKIVSK